jgi:N-acetylglutamate synthase/N-acetylornithine aminotransferase
MKAVYGATGDGNVQKAQAFAAAFAAAALLHAAPASAGVILEQPQMKKVRNLLTSCSDQYVGDNAD